MSKANERTIQTYDDGVQIYIKGTQQQVLGNQKEWIDLAFSDVDKTAAILEIGSAFGRDARYLMAMGYAPTLTDATPGFVEYLHEQGFDAELLDIVHQQPKGLYDAIFASAVFLHFTDDDFDHAVTHVRNSLKDNGKFIVSLKKGVGETWSREKMNDDRYFHYWNRVAAQERLGHLGLALVNDQTLEDDIWLYLTLRKVT